MLILPIVVYSASLLTYPETVIHANNYITRFEDRNKYLIIPAPFKYVNGSISDDNAFISGGLLNKSEYDATLVNNKSYLATGKEYWLSTQVGSNRYYVDAYLDSKAESNKSGTRVTEIIKPTIQVNGKGTYVSPWTFKEGYTVDIIPNSESYGIVSPHSVTVDSGGTAEFNLVPNVGYAYTGKDDCGLTRVGNTNRYQITNVKRDISCVANFDLKAYAFNLTSENGYEISPNPNTIYYKKGRGFFTDSEATQSINRLTTLPKVTGYTYNGYKYKNENIIDTSGNINQTITSMDYNEDNQNLVVQVTPNQYNINYTLDGGTDCGLPRNATYDQAVTLCTPTRNGYTFSGWTSTTIGTTAMNGSNSWNGSLTTNNSFQNLTTTNNGAVTLIANWNANTYNLNYVLNDGAYGASHPTSANYDQTFTVDNASKGITLTFSAGSTGATISYTGGSSVTANNQAVSYTFAGWNISGMDSTSHTLGSTTSTSTTANGITATSFKNLRSTSGTVTFTATFNAPTITLPVVTKTGHTCKWTSSGVTDKASNGSFTPTGETSRTFTASCTANNYTCSAGQYLPANATSCSNCTNGYFCTGGTFNFNASSNQGLTACTTLGSNYTKSDAAAAANTKCYMAVTAGYYKTSATGNTTQKCAAGKYKEAHNSYYNASDSCTNCAAGTSSAEGSTASSACTNCAAGTYNTTAGSTCAACPIGKYCTGGTNNTNCPTGTYRASTGGKVVGDCTKCSAGTSSPAGSTASSACTTCSSGTYNTTAGAICSPCPQGKYCTGGQNNTNCPAGTYRASTGGKVVGDCTSCGSGYTSPEGSTSSSACVATTINVTTTKTVTCSGSNSFKARVHFTYTYYPSEPRAVINISKIDFTKTNETGWFTYHYTNVIGGGYVNYTIQKDRNIFFGGKPVVFYLGSTRQNYWNYYQGSTGIKSENLSGWARFSKVSNSSVDPITQFDPITVTSITNDVMAVKCYFDYYSDGSYRASWNTTVNFNLRSGS